GEVEVQRRLVLGAGAALALIDVGLVDQLDPLGLEQHEQLVDLLGVGVVIRQVVVDLAVCQIALLLALFEQGLQAVVELFHQTLPHPRVPDTAFKREETAGRRPAAPGTDPPQAPPPDRSGGLAPPDPPGKYQGQVPRSGSEAGAAAPCPTARRGRSAADFAAPP